MQQKTPPPPPPPPPTHLPKIPSSFDWSDLLDFNLDENLSISFHQHEPDQGQPPDDHTGRVRKTDPRLVCSNYLAGIVPCACPELDAKLEEEKAALPGKKRARTVGGPVRCQVTGCEADISGLKGYHKRHRVCLRCANASEVVVDGETKRYCQQCGKFHVLSDFDEGKRSCRRKLERHNNRRRRKPNDSKKSIEKEAQQIVLANDVSGDDDVGKDGICASFQIEERERLLESEGHVSTLCSVPDPQNSDSLVSFTASDETHIDRTRVHTMLNPKYERSSSYSKNKSSFSSVCPSGRISFKLYDWNPAEFPRPLRHQIFQWLASMPIELEGYIRPGCTILTAFIAMPRPTWHKLLEEPALRIKDLVASPGSMLSGRGPMLVYLNDMIFHVTKDAISVVKVKVKDRAPKLHYIYPTCFEAGRPMEFVACGSDLLQPNFRFLVSFAGRYLAYNMCVSTECCEEGVSKRIDHQLLKIYVPQTDIELFGPAFIEVENQSGLSNYIPILVGDKETCTEMEILLQKFDLPEEQNLSSCEFFALRQAKFSEVLLDVAWLLKKTLPEHKLKPSHIQRFNLSLHFLIENESSVILERVFCSLKSAVANSFSERVCDVDSKLLRRNMEIAQSRLARTRRSFYSHSCENDDRSVGSTMDQDFPRILKKMLRLNVSSQSPGEGPTVPLLKGDVIMTVDLDENPRKSCKRFLTRTFFTPRTLIVAISALGICFGLCAVVLHPQRVDQIATTIRSLLDNS